MGSYVLNAAGDQRHHAGAFHLSQHSHMDLQDELVVVVVDPSQNPSYLHTKLLPIATSMNSRTA